MVAEGWSGAGWAAAAWEGAAWEFAAWGCAAYCYVAPHANEEPVLLMIPS